MSGFPALSLPFFRFLPMPPATLRRAAILGIRFAGGCLERRRQRLALARLDDRLLSDIGLRRCQAEREACRLGWRL